MSRPARAASELGGTLYSMAFFLAGIPLGIGILTMIQSGTLAYDDLQRYTEHTVEQVELIAFCCAICTLLGKYLSYLRERTACSTSPLPAWDGKPVPVTEAKRLRETVSMKQTVLFKRTYMGRRVGNVIEFVESRGSANELDDQLRCLADNDAMALDSTYSLLRFITWAIPILGFLGTVLGITGSISGITPEKLEKDLSLVTNGLSQAFDSTAMALFLTMVLMFITSLIEKLEQGILKRVDSYIDGEFAHRFIRSAADGPAAVALSHDTHGLLQITQQVVEKQAAVWAGTMQKAEKQWSEAGSRQQEAMTTALQHALEYALTRYGQRLGELEDQLLKRNQSLLDGVNQLAGALQETGRENQLALARLTDSLGLQLETVAKMQTNEEQLTRLQETLSRNLELLTSSGTFEQAVQSLTAAIHLLTTRVPGANLRIAPRSDAA